MQNTKVGEPSLIVLPTGSGKGTLFAALSTQAKGRVLITVPSGELLQQGLDKIKQADSESDVGIVQANINQLESKVMIATRQSLSHKKSTRIEKMLQHGEIEYIVLDEVHNAVDQLQRILRKVGKSAKIIGMTATPFSKKLNKLFKGINYSKTILEMIEMNYLTEPLAMTVESSTNLSNVKIVNGEFQQHELEQAVNTYERNRIIVEAYKKFASNRKATIVFCVGIDHAKSLVEEFKLSGIKSKSIDSNMKKSERDSIIKEFESGQLPVIVNVNILSTGYDVPFVDCILLGKPTRSLIYYTQCIGRGLRLHSYKENCLILDIADNCRSHDLMNISSVFDMPIKHGETPRKAQKRIKIEKEQEEERKRLEKLKQEELKRKREEDIQLRAKQIQLFNRDMTNRFKECRYDWFNVDLLSYALTYEMDKHYVVEQDGDMFHCYRVSTNKENKFVQHIGSNEVLNDLIKVVENHYITRPNTYVNKDSDWKKERPTENQMKYVRFAKSKWEAHVYFTKSNIRNTMKKYNNIN